MTEIALRLACRAIVMPWDDDGGCLEPFAFLSAYRLLLTTF
jgi:hypothetical protein